MVNRHTRPHQASFAASLQPIHLHEVVEYEGWEQVSEGCEHTFARMLAQDRPSAARLPLLLPRIVSVDFTAQKTDYYLSCRDNQDRQVVRLDFIPDQDADVWMEVLASQGARDIAQLLAGARAVTTLTLCTNFEDLAVDELEGVFRCFPSLRTLDLRGRGTLEVVWEALTPATDATDILCPNLKMITVEDGDPSWYAGDDFFDEILPMLRERDACGCRLASLELELMEGDEDEDSETEYNRLRAKYLPELLKVVDRVAYDYLDFEPFDWERDAGI